MSYGRNYDSLYSKTNCKTRPPRAYMVCKTCAAYFTMEYLGNIGTIPSLTYNPDANPHSSSGEVSRDLPDKEYRKKRVTINDECYTKKHEPYSECEECIEIETSSITSKRVSPRSLSAESLHRSNQPCEDCNVKDVCSICGIASQMDQLVSPASISVNTREQSNQRCAGCKECIEEETCTTTSCKVCKEKPRNTITFDISDSSHRRNSFILTANTSNRSIQTPYYDDCCLTLAPGIYPSSSNCTDNSSSPDSDICNQSAPDTSSCIQSLSPDNGSFIQSLLPDSSCNQSISLCNESVLNRSHDIVSCNSSTAPDTSSIGQSTNNDSQSVTTDTGRWVQCVRSNSVICVPAMTSDNVSRNQSIPSGTNCSTQSSSHNITCFTKCTPKIPSDDVCCALSKCIPDNDKCCQNAISDNWSQCVPPDSETVDSSVCCKEAPPESPTPIPSKYDICCTKAIPPPVVPSNPPKSDSCVQSIPSDNDCCSINKTSGNDCPTPIPFINDFIECISSGNDNFFQSIFSENNCGPRSRCNPCCPCRPCIASCLPEPCCRSYNKGRSFGSCNAGLFSGRGNIPDACSGTCYWNNNNCYKVGPRGPDGPCLNCFMTRLPYCPNLPGCILTGPTGRCIPMS